MQDMQIKLLYRPR